MAWLPPRYKGDSGEGGNGEKHIIEMTVIPELEGLIRARQQYGWGVLLIIPTVWRSAATNGTETQPGCVVSMSNGDADEKSVPMGEGFAGQRK